MEGEKSSWWSSGVAIESLFRKIHEVNLKDGLGVIWMNNSGKKYHCEQTNWYVWYVLSPFVGNKLEAPKKPAQINLSQETNQEARM